MSRIASESRTLRAGLSSRLSTIGWSELTYAEGWGDIDIENPLLNIYIVDNGKASLEIGRTNQHKLFNRVAQIDVYMESEDRVRAICEDVMEYLDETSFTVNDLLTTSGIGYMSFPESESITSIFLPPSMNSPEILRWRGSVRGRYEAYYPNGGEPI